MAREYDLIRKSTVLGRSGNDAYYRAAHAFEGKNMALPRENPLKSRRG